MEQVKAEQKQDSVRLIAGLKGNTSDPKQWIEKSIKEANCVIVKRRNLWRLHGVLYADLVDCGSAPSQPGSGVAARGQVTAANHSKTKRRQGGPNFCV